MANQPTVAIEKWLTDGWKLYKQNRFTFFFASLLAAPLCIPPLFIFFSGPLYAGLCGMAIQSMRGGDPRIRDIFKGFGRYWAAFFLWLIFPVSLILLCAPPIGILFVPLLWATSMLALPLLIDQGQAGGSAFRTAIKTVLTWKNWWRFWLYGLALTFISLMGIFGFLIGLLITLPFAACAQAIAYRDIFKPEEAFRADIAQPWQKYPFKLNAKYSGPISRIRELHDRIFEEIHSANASIKSLLAGSIEDLNSVFAKAADLMSRLQQIENYLLTTTFQKLHAEKAEITMKLGESSNPTVYSHYREALKVIEERIENHERLEDLSAQITAQLTTLRVSLDNAYAKIIRIKTTEISNARFASDDVSHELRNLQIEMDALLSSLDEMVRSA